MHNNCETLKGTQSTDTKRQPTVLWEESRSEAGEYSVFVSKLRVWDLILAEACGCEWARQTEPRWSIFTEDILTCHSRKNTGITLTIALLYESVPVSHGSVTVSQHAQYQGHFRCENITFCHGFHVELHVHILKRCENRLWGTFCPIWRARCYLVSSTYALPS